MNDTDQAGALATAGSVNATDYEGYSYDAAGNRTNLRKRDGRNIFYVYDNLNRVTSKTYPQGGATPVHYNYDLRGLQLSARFNSQSGEGVTNTYDGFGRLVSHSINMSGVTRTLAYEYDAAGNRTRITHPDTTTFFSTDYDALSRPWRMREPDNDPIATMAYDAHGRPSALGFLGGSGAAYTHDNLSRLSALAHDLSGTSHDAAWTYAYNPASQIGSVTRTNDYYAWTNHYAVNRPYTADGLNRYSAAGSASFTYDANGNLTVSLTANGTRIYTYDIENRLIGASGGLTLTYDPLGRLHQSSGGPSGTTRFLYDGDALVEEYSGSNTLLRRFVHGPGTDVPLVWYEGANIRRYLHADHQGSIVAVGQAYAGTFALNRYDEYGVPAAGNGGRFQYTGQIWLPDLGMYHYKARVYSPTLGRFMQTDPIGYDDQINLYAYVGNDPVNHTDPTGQACDTGSLLGVSVQCNVHMDYQETETSASGRAPHGPRANGGGGNPSDGGPRPPPDFIPPRNPPSEPPATGPWRNIPGGGRVAPGPDGTELRRMPPNRIYRHGYWRMSRGAHYVDPSTRQQPSGRNLTRAEFNARTHVELPRQPIQELPQSGRMSQGISITTILLYFLGIIGPAPAY